MSKDILLTPGVSNNPVHVSRFGICFPSNNAYNVVDHHVPDLGVVHASTCVLDERFSVDTRCNGTTGVDFTLQLVNNVRTIEQVTVGSIFGNGGILERKRKK